MQPQWLEWAQRLQAIAQIGLTYAQNVYDIERYEQIRAVAEQITANHTGADPQIVHTLFTHDKGYTTPKIDVRGVVFKDDALLLVQETADQNRWTLPGGWADVGDSPAAAVEREIFEESGYEARAVKLLALWDRRKHAHPPTEFHAYKLFFRCELTGGAPKSSHETAGIAFFREDEIPEDLSLARVLPEQIKRCFEHLRNPDLPTDFD
jgi:ADP-ribose pyrophosphatase YjhB (NUDIX family)